MKPLIPHFTPARRAGDYIFVSGQLPFVAPGEIIEGDIVVHLQQVMANLSEALEGVGASLSDVVKNMIWLVNTEDFPAFNKAYADYFPGQPPARATVCSALMVPGALIEIEAVAYKPL